MRALLVAASLVTSMATVSAQTPVRSGKGVVDPVLISTEQPRYTEAARQAKVQGTVELEAVINADGTVGDVTVTKSLDKTTGLDAAAVAAAKAWKFRPGKTADGTAVPVIVTLMMEFKLRDPEPQSAAIRAPILSDLPREFVLDARVYASPGLESPVVAKMVEPKYTSNAMLAKIQGSADVDIVIGTDGRVVRARLARSLDAVHGLDLNTVEAAKQWTFAPGMQNGAAVPVLARITLNFRLH